MKKIAAILTIILLSLTFNTAPAVAATQGSVSVAELNCERDNYTKNLTVDGVKMDWVYRSARMITFFKKDVKADVYILVECEPGMVKDLDKGMGAGWTYKVDAGSNNGFLYNYNKVSVSSFGVYNYKNTTQGRALVHATLTDDTTGSQIGIGAVHLASTHPTDRDEQTKETLDFIGDKPYILAGDLNALAAPVDDCTNPAPRTQLKCGGFKNESFGPTFNNHTATATWELDYIGTNSDDAALSNVRNISTYPRRVSDHNATSVTLTF